MDTRLLEIQKIPEKDEERLLRLAEQYLVGKGWRFSQFEKMTRGKIIKALLMQLVQSEVKGE